jgi:hypothetical protein
MPMNLVEHNMASRTVLAWPQPDSTAQLWLKIVRMQSQKNAIRNPLRRLAFWLRWNWKSVLVAVTFWAGYGYFCAVCLASWVCFMRLPPDNSLDSGRGLPALLLFPHRQCFPGTQ